MRVRSILFLRSMQFMHARGAERMLRRRGRARVELRGFQPTAAASRDVQAFRLHAPESRNPFTARHGLSCRRTALSRAVAGASPSLLPQAAVRLPARGAGGCRGRRGADSAPGRLGAAVAPVPAAVQPSRRRLALAHLSPRRWLVRGRRAQLRRAVS